MIVLYSGSGAGDFELWETACEPGAFNKLRQHAIALLKARGSHRAAELLAQPFPFSVQHASNHWNDDFEVLHATLPLKQYEAARLQKETKADRAAWAVIAGVLGEVGCSLRFIAVSLDTSRQPALQQNGLKEAQIKKLVYRYIGVQSGYLGNFSYQSHADFYTDLDLDIDPYKYSGTTRERFIQILICPTNERVS